MMRREVASRRRTCCLAHAQRPPASSGSLSLLLFPIRPPALIPRGLRLARVRARGGLRRRARLVGALACALDRSARWRRLPLPGAGGSLRVGSSCHRAVTELRGCREECRFPIVDVSVSGDRREWCWTPKGSCSDVPTGMHRLEAAPRRCRGIHGRLGTRQASFDDHLQFATMEVKQRLLQTLTLQAAPSRGLAL